MGLGAATADTSSVSTTATATTIESAPENTTSAGDEADNNTDSKRLKSGAFAGIVVGVAAAVAIMITAAVFFIMRAKKKNMSKGEMIGNDESLTGQESNAFHDRETYGGLMKKNWIEDVGRRVELEDHRTYEMSAGHHGVAEMPQNS